MNVTAPAGDANKPNAVNAAMTREKNRLNKSAFRRVRKQAGYSLRFCQWICAVLLSVTVGGCESKRETASGVIGSVKGFAGIAVADEPRAALAARDVLTAGGSAADAAVALYFTLAVTLPSSAGLGGGGVCLIRDPRSEQTEALEFLPTASPGGTIGVPGSVRGMAALQAKYGRLPWSQLLARAEDLARGTTVGRALARELATAGAGQLGDSEMRRIFGRADGTLADEGDGLQQLDLAGTLGQIRRDGAGAFYSGSLAVRMMQAAQSVGLPLSTDVLRATVPQYAAPVMVDVGDDAAYFAPPPADGGLVGAQLLALLSAGQGYGATAEAERPHLFVEAAKRAFIERARWRQPDGTSGEQPGDLLSGARIHALMQSYNPQAATPAESIGAAPAAADENPWATGFVVADQDGLTVACEVTMNGLFGSGRMVPGTGVILAAPPAGAGGFPMGPMIVVGPQGNAVDFAAAASGGTTGTTAEIAVFLGSAVLRQPLQAAIAAKRIHHNGAPDTVFYEGGENDAIVSGLQQRGHGVAPAGVLGRVNALWCPDGLPDNPESCQAGSDPRGNGLAVLQAE
jgi:gamma-glutamyltranspeptidase/glutathione hydrolase